MRRLLRQLRWGAWCLATPFTVRWERRKLRNVAEVVELWKTREGRDEDPPDHNPPWDEQEAA